MKTSDNRGGMQQKPKGYSSAAYESSKMSGQIIQTLRTSPPLAALTEAELAALANCGRIENYSPGQTILKASGQDERVFILSEGRVMLHLGIWPENGQCGGDATVEIATRGAGFGWTTWVRAERILVSARAAEPTSLVALDLDRLRDSQTLWKVGQQMVQRLYGFLLEGGVCPPNPQGLLRLKRLAQE